MKIGSQYLGNRQCQFTVWAPQRDRVSLHLISPQEKLLEMTKDGQGYWHTTVNQIDPETLYFYQLDGQIDRPDPASHAQPQGVHGPSAIIDHQPFIWTDETWVNIPLANLIIYELHVGTFTPAGTFEAIIERLPDLKDLGINTIEIMPVAQYPGDRNWGYDGVYLYAVQSSYGGCLGLKKLVNACHQIGIAVILDVVYNHLGPEGNYLWDYGPYFTNRYHTPWGDAVNFDGPYSNEVRNFFLQNALYWLEYYHIDGLRLDAVHAIYDMSAQPFLQQLSAQVAEFSRNHHRQCYLIAESDLNDVKMLRPRNWGGLGQDTQWCDDFHHSLHCLLTGEKTGYYQDFGSITDLEKAWRSAFVYTGQYSSYRRRNHGNSPDQCQPCQFVVFSQNHDQVGNRLGGERLASLIDFAGLKLVAGAVLLSPYVPMLFMGEEYGETAPFLYFVSHGDRDLIEAVRQGRAKEFVAFGWHDPIPDPQGIEVFMQSKLNWEKAQENQSKKLRSFYQKLIQLRQTMPALSPLNQSQLTVKSWPEKILYWQRQFGENMVLCLMNFSDQVISINPDVPLGNWSVILDSSASEWLGPNDTGSMSLIAGQSVTLYPHSFILYTTNQ